LHDTTAYVDLTDPENPKLTGHCAIYANPGPGLQWSKWTEFKFADFDVMGVWWCHSRGLPLYGKVHRLWRDQHGIRIEADLWRNTPGFIQLLQSGIIGYSVDMVDIDSVAMADGTSYAKNLTIWGVSLSFCTACATTPINIDNAARKLAAIDWRSGVSDESGERLQAPENTKCCLWSSDFSRSEHAQEKINKAVTYIKAAKG
jgi:hypothetical protein